MLRNSASAPEVGLLGRISEGRRADFEISPIIIRPKSGREARFPARKQYLRNIGQVGVLITIPWLVIQEQADIYRFLIRGAFAPTQGFRISRIFQWFAVQR